MTRIFLGLLIVGLIILNNGASTVASYSSETAEACPVLRVKIDSVAVTPLQPAQQHIVNVSWAVSTPQCYTTDKFSVKGTITFANGQKKNFAQSVSGNLTSAQIRAPGLLPSPTYGISALAPRSVTVEVSAVASAPVFGIARTVVLNEGDVVSPPLSSCLPQVQIQNAQAAFAGLVFSPENPKGNHFPKFKVKWQVNALPSCYRIDNFTVTVSLPRDPGGPKSKTVTVPGGQTATEIVFDNLPVSADFTPGVIVANVKANGTARITGSAQNDALLN